MRQFLLPEDWDGGLLCSIVGGRARYISRVLRLTTGDEFPAVDASGRRWLARVGEVGRELVLLEVMELPLGFDVSAFGGARRRASLPVPGVRVVGASLAGGRDSPSITLVQGLPRGTRMDLIVRQAAETGVERVIPLLSRNCVARFEGEEGLRRARWQRIAREALQQSGSSIATVIGNQTPLEKLEEALGPERGPRLRLLFHEAPLAQAGLHEYLSGAPAEIALCVGPEGGFAPGAVLRTETAALFAVAAVEIILSERSSWTPKPS
jgi:16S rRNA (uracil1498-N3)-methyltransferase